MSFTSIEIFTAGCPLCKPVVNMVKELTQEGFNEVTVYDLVKEYNSGDCLAKVEEYGIKRIPSVVVDGKLLACCAKQEITKDDLKNTGIGQNM